MNSAHRYRPAMFVKLDLIVARFEAITETAVGIVKFRLRALIRIGLQNNLADTGLVCGVRRRRLLGDPLRLG